MAHKCLFNDIKSLQHTLLIVGFSNDLAVYPPRINKERHKYFSVFTDRRPWVLLVTFSTPPSVQRKHTKLTA